MVICRERPIILPGKIVQNLEPLTVQGVEKVLVVAVNLMNEGDLEAFTKAA